MKLDHNIHSPEWLVVPNLGYYTGSWLLALLMSNKGTLSRICKRSDQPKIERLVNNDARLILRRKVNGATTR